MKLLEMDASFMQRAIKEGFSGGKEAQRDLPDGRPAAGAVPAEDETDSGLGIDKR